MTKQQIFLEAYIKNAGIIRLAAASARVGVRQHYEWLKSDPDYARRIGEAEIEIALQLESELRDRVLHGTPEVLVYQGEIQYERDKDGKVTDKPVTVRRRNDILLMFACKAMMPSKYRDNYQPPLAPPADDRPADPDLARLSLEQLRTLRAIAEAARGPIVDVEPVAAAGASNGRVLEGE